MPNSRHDTSDDKDHRVQGEGGLDADRVLGCVAGTEGSCGDDTSDTTECDAECTAVGALGLTRDARVHPSDHERDVGVGAHAGEEAGKVAGTDGGRVSEHGASSDVEERVEHDEGGAVAVLVGEDAVQDGPEESGDVRREGEDLGQSLGEAHAAEEVRHEVCEGVRDECGAHEHETVGPVGWHETVCSNLLECQRVVNRVTAVGFDAGLDDGSLLLG